MNLLISRDSVGDSMRDSMRDSVRDSERDSVGDPVRLCSKVACLLLPYPPRMRSGAGGDETGAAREVLPAEDTTPAVGDGSGSLGGEEAVAVQVTGLELLPGGDLLEEGRLQLLGLLAAS